MYTILLLTAIPFKKKRILEFVADLKRFFYCDM